jgi:hypothetical protein
MAAQLGPRRGVAEIQRKINWVQLDSGEDAKDTDHFIDHKDLLRLIVVQTHS